MLLGKLEQLVLLAVLRLEANARAKDIRALLTEETGHPFPRGSVYASLDRLTRKGLLTWETEASTPERGGIPRRRFSVTDEGLAAVRAAREMELKMSAGLEGLWSEG